MTPPPNRRRAPSWLFPAIAVFSFAILLTVAARSLGGGVAPVPPAFDSSRSLAQASQDASDAGKPVLAFLTADWCGPCQAFKRGALSDPRVVHALDEKTVTVYLDVDHAPEAASFNVMSIPTLVLLRNGAEKARLSGAVGADDLLSWLNAALAK